MDEQTAPDFTRNDFVRIRLGDCPGPYWRAHTAEQDGLHGIVTDVGGVTDHPITVHFCSPTGGHVRTREPNNAGRFKTDELVHATRPAPGWAPASLHLTEWDTWPILAIR